MKLFTSLALAAAGVSATEDKCLICSHVGFAGSEDEAIAGKRFKIIPPSLFIVLYSDHNLNLAEL